VELFRTALIRGGGGSIISPSFQAAKKGLKWNILSLVEGIFSWT